MSQKVSKVFKPAAWLFYLVIGIEILYMISPFAIYYYSTYGPTLNFLHGSAFTAWMTGFFLPHYASTSSFILNSAHNVGRILLVMGVLFFLIGAGHIYYYKFTKKGAVTGGLYKIIRHPQYTALTVMGLGLLLVWPRFTVLIMYVTMLLVYLWLARMEEKECEQKFGESYRSYKASTNMFLPFSLPGFKMFKITEKWPKTGLKRTAFAMTAYVALLTLVIVVAFEVKDYSVSQLSTYYSENSATISVTKMASDEIQALLKIASDDPDVRARLAEVSSGEAGLFLNYVVPLEWYLPDVPMEKIPEGFLGHRQPADYDRNLYKVLFTQARLPGGGSVSGPDIIKMAVGRTPLLLVKVSKAEGKVAAIETPPPHVRWGDIPTPLF